MSDAETTTTSDDTPNDEEPTGEEPTGEEPTGEEPTDDGFDPVQVFDDAADMDLRPGADACYKCTTCDTSCPVAEVDDEFPGPKFQGPEQWRLKRKADTEIDDSIMDCSNCMRCDGACPSDVPLSQMHNEARGSYVENQLAKLSRTYWRNRLLANYRIMAEIGSRVPRLANFVLGLSVTKWINETVVGITSEREFPAFAEETFREWWEKRGGYTTSKKRAVEARESRGASGTSTTVSGAAEPRAARGGNHVESDDKRVAYFHGCYSNYNTPEVGKALVRVFESFGYEVAVPDQGCSGTPMFANGMLDDAARDAELNVSSLGELVDRGFDVVASCTSCSMSLRQEYPELFDFEGTQEVAESTFEALEYLRFNEDLSGAIEDADASDREELVEEFGRMAYHAPCHARNQGLEGQAIELLSEIAGVDPEDVGDSCSGISGTYGWKTEHYDTSMAIGEEMFAHMDDVDTDTGLTECPTCAMQMEHGTGYDIRHPLEVLEATLVD